MPTLPSHNKDAKDDDITDDDSDSDVMILETVSRTPHNLSPGISNNKMSSEDSEYKHKQNLISGIYGKTSDKISPRKVESNAVAEKHLRDLASPDLSEQSGNSDDDDSGDDLDEDDNSDSSSSSSSGSEAADPEPAVVTAGTSCSDDLICDNSVENNSSSDVSSEDSLPPPLLEPQVPEVKRIVKSKKIISRAKDKFKHNSRAKTKSLKNKQKVECGSQTEETAFTSSSILPPSSPSSFSSSPSPSPIHNLVEKESFPSLAPAPPLLFGVGTQRSKHNRGRPRKNPPTLQPEISSQYEELPAIVPGEMTEPMSVDNSADDASEEAVEEKSKVKKGKLSVLFAAAKHWQRTQESKKLRNDLYEFTDDVSDKNKDSSSASSESDQDSSPTACDTNHSKVYKQKSKKSKHKPRLLAAPVPLQKYKRAGFTQIKSPSCPIKTEKIKSIQSKEMISSESELETKLATSHHSAKKTKHRKPLLSRPSSSSAGDVQDNFFNNLSEKVAKKVDKKPSFTPAESDASSCVDDLAHPPQQMKRDLKSETKPSQLPVVYQQFSTKINNSFGKTSGLIFSKKFCTLKPDAFWKKSRRKLSIDEGLRETKSELQHHQSDVKQEHQQPPSSSSSSGSVATKASLKEMPNVPRNQVQQMINVLASATRIHNKSIKSKKREKEEFRNETTAYETQSEDEDSNNGKRKNKKGWKSKHKNVVDPVFLGELEHLIRDIASVQLEVKLSKDFWPDRPSDSVPSIFKRRKIFMGKRKRDLNKTSRRGKTSKNSVPIEILDLTSECDEQRLPLKKRHHHLQGGEGKNVDMMNTSFEDIEMEPPSKTNPPAQALIQIKSPEKISREYSRNSSLKSIDDNVFREKKSGGGGMKILQDKLVKKPTAADRIVEKLGIQIKKENSNCSTTSNDSRGSLRRISKEVDYVAQEKASHSSGNSSKEQKPSSKSHNKLPSIQIKSESKLKGPGTFVDNIQGCIDKYTAASSSTFGLEKNKIKNSSSFSNQPQETSRNQENILSRKYSQQPRRGEERENNSFSSSRSYIPIFSSPEPDIPASGRESSLSQSSNSSDCCVINPDGADQVSSAVLF